MKIRCILGFQKNAQWKFWPDCANAQADLNLCQAHTSEGTFSDVVTQKNLMICNDKHDSLCDNLICINITPNYSRGNIFQLTIDRV